MTVTNVHENSFVCDGYTDEPSEEIKREKQCSGCNHWHEKINEDGYCEKCWGEGE